MCVRNRVASLIYKILLFAASGLAVALYTGLFSGSFSLSALSYYPVVTVLLCFLFSIFAIIRTIAGLSKKGIRGYTRFSGHVKGAFLVAVLMNIPMFYILRIVVPGGEVPVQQGEIASLLVNLIVPVLFMGDWFLFDKKGKFRVFDPFIWLVIPYLYYTYILIRAQFGFSHANGSLYPYSFLNVDSIGWAGLLKNIGIYSLLIVLIGFFIFLVDFLLDKLAPETAEDNAEPEEDEETAVLPFLEGVNEDTGELNAEEFGASLRESEEGLSLDDVPPLFTEKDIPAETPLQPTPAVAFQPLASAAQEEKDIPNFEEVLEPDTAPVAAAPISAAPAFTLPVPPVSADIPVPAAPLPQDIAPPPVPNKAPAPAFIPAPPKPQVPRTVAAAPVAPAARPKPVSSTAALEEELTAAINALGGSALAPKAPPAVAPLKEDTGKQPPIEAPAAPVAEKPAPRPAPSPWPLPQSTPPPATPSRTEAAARPSAVSGQRYPQQGTAATPAQHNIAAVPRPSTPPAKTYPTDFGANAASSGFSSAGRSTAPASYPPQQPAAANVPPAQPNPQQPAPPAASPAVPLRYVRQTAPTQASAGHTIPSPYRRSTGINPQAFAGSAQPPAAPAAPQYQQAQPPVAPSPNKPAFTPLSSSPMPAPPEPQTTPAEPSAAPTPAGEQPER